MNKVSHSVGLCLIFITSRTTLSAIRSRKGESPLVQPRRVSSPRNHLIQCNTLRILSSTNEIWVGDVLMATITKKNLVDRIAESTETARPTTKAVVQCFLDEIIAELAKDNRLEFRGFGIFEARERQARTAQNPKTLEKIRVPAKRSIKFRAGRLMKESLNNKIVE